jgi:hypothetical protein
LFILFGGCVALGTTESSAPPPPTGSPCQVVAAWEPAVRFAADPVHNGAMNPGLAGRVYLFGADIGTPMTGKGSLHVELFDASAAGQPVLTETWDFDTDTLKRLQRRDMIGWGYSLFLPWGSYRPEVTRVLLRVRYDSKGVAPLFVESAPLTLSRPEDGFSAPVVSQSGKPHGG